MMPDSAYSMLEYAGVATGLLYLVLAIYQRRECWGFYVISAIAYFPVMAHQDLYLYAGMQFFFAASGIYGWYKWGREAAQPFQVGTIGTAVHFRWIVAGLLLSMGFADYLSLFGGFWNALADALLSTFSLIATLLTARKILAGWHYWIAVNVLAVALYAYKAMWPTTLLYSIYLLSSIYGVRRWQRTK